MNVVDENFPAEQARLLQNQNINVHKIGKELGRKGMQDDEIIALLHRLNKPTYFTLDNDFFRRRLRHPGYGLVYLDVNQSLAAEYVRRVLQHSDFRTKRQR